MRIVVLADTHGRLRRAELEYAIKEVEPECIFCLGDMDYCDYEILQDVLAEAEYSDTIQTPVLAILGNHDSRTLLDEVQRDFFPEIVNLDCKTTTVGGFTIGGFAGSVKYKDTDYYCVRTQGQAQKDIQALPKVDILLCHSQPSFDAQVFFAVTENGLAVKAHDGLYALGEYIKKYQPRFVFHGHLHDMYLAEHGDTEIICCYGVNTADTDNL